jgi:hypothetical protein
MIRSSTRAPIAAVAAIALVGALLVSGSHRAAVRHVECVEHGEQVEVEQVGAVSDVTDTSAASFHASDWAVTGDDDHCGILGAASRPVSAAASGCDSVGVIALDDPAITITATPAPASALYRLAPKTSPPV